MKTLYLLRHADTLPASLKTSDFERVLSPQGEKDAEMVGAFMKENGLTPDVVLSSAAVRTTQTTTLILEKISGGVRAHFEQRLYPSDASKLLAEIQGANDSVEKLMLVAHNPGVADLAMFLGNVAQYTPGTLAVFTADCDRWADFEPELVTLEKVFAP